MAKPPTSVRSIRLPDTTWREVERLAEAAGQNVNSFATAAVDAEIRRRTTTDPYADAGRRALKALAEQGVKHEPTSPGGIVLGQPFVPYGSRLKGPKK